MPRIVIAVGAAILTGSAAGAQVPAADAEAFAKAAKKVHGKLDKNETWSGKVLMDGDVEVPKGIILTIVPGTEVRVAATDLLKTGWRTDRVELHVLGSIRIQGTDDKPVVFRPVAKLEDNEDYSWHGIVIRPQSNTERRSLVTAVRVFNAFSGIQVPTSGPSIKQSVFLKCMMGVEVGSSFKDRSNQAIRAGLASPEVRGCRFADCKTGVYLQGRGSPDVRNCVFYKNTTGLGNRREGITGSLEDPGAIVERCAFLENYSGVVGQALVRDSIFVGNSTGIKLSAQHYRYASRVDHVAMRTNLFHGNSAEVEGDTGMDSNPIHGDPQFIGPIDSLNKPGKALPKCLELAATSPARTRAADGGDLGPLSTAMGKFDEAFWEPAGPVIGEVFAMPTDLGGMNPTAVVGGRPRAGRRIGKSWSVQPMPGKLGAFDMSAIFGRSSKGGWIAFSVRANKKGTAKLEINGDVHRVGIFINGKPSSQNVADRRRFGQKGIVLDLDVKSGSNSFYLRVETWGRTPRLGLACVDNLVATKQPVPKSASLTIKSGKLIKRRDDCYMEFTTSGALSWTDNGRLGLFKILDAEGKLAPDQERIDVAITAQRRLRLNRVPQNWKKPLTVEFTGLRGPKGEVYGTAKYLVK